MLTREERESFDQPTDPAGVTIARGALALLYPLAPGESEDPFSFYLSPTVRHCAGLVSERLELRWTVKPHNARFELIRKPADSASRMDGASFVPDRPGVYVVCAWLGPWMRDVTIAAWKREDLMRLGKAPHKGQPDAYWIDRRKRVQMLANDPRVNVDSLIAALEVNELGCAGFDGTLFGTPGQDGVSITGW
jgi:hypothetical protein